MTLPAPNNEPEAQATPSLSDGSAKRRVDAVAFWSAVVAIAGIALLWPGAAPFLNDEARLISNALTANEQGVLALKGIRGSVGIHYGPLPTWVYQGLLLLTRNLVCISFIKNVTSLALLTGVLVALARELKLSRWPVLIVLSSPYVYYLNRLIWDDTLLMPSSALLFLCCHQIGRQRRPLAVFLAVVVTVYLVHTQVKSVFVLVAFYAAVLLFYHRWLIERWKVTFPVLLGGAAVCVPYAVHVICNLQLGRARKSTALECLSDALSGARFFTFLGWPGYYLPEMHSSSFCLPVWLTVGLTGLGYLVLAAFFLGLFTAGRDALGHWRASRHLCPSDAVALCAFLVLAVSTVFFVALRQQVQPHYLASTWFAYFYFVWLAVDRFLDRSLVRALLAAQLVSQAVLLFLLVVFVHVNGGNRQPFYGATLANQIEVIRHLQTLPSDTTIRVNVRNYQLFPHTFWTLDRLLSSPRPGPRGPGAEPLHVEVDYLEPGDADSGWITVRRSASASGAPDPPPEAGR